MAGKIHSGGTVHFRLRGDRRVVRRDGAKTLTVDRRPCAARLQRSLFPADRLARAPGRRTPLAVRPLPRGRARPGRLYRSVGAERQIDSPIPMPPDLVVKKGLNRHFYGALSRAVLYEHAIRSARTNGFIHNEAPPLAIPRQPLSGSSTWRLL